MSEEWMHSNSLQVTPDGLLLMSVRHLDTIIAISPQADRIAWRIGRFGSDFNFPNPADKFYHEHFVRMLENGNLLMLDNGNGRPSSDGGQYTRALELAGAVMALLRWSLAVCGGDAGLSIGHRASRRQKRLCLDKCALTMLLSLQFSLGGR